MKKKKNKELIIVTGILLGLVLCLLAGNIYLKEAENRQKLEKSQLEKEKETLTEQIRETEEKQTELQKELEKIKKETETEQETQAEPEETEKQEEQQDNAEETESQETKVAELNTITGKTKRKEKDLRGEILRLKDELDKKEAEITKAKKEAQKALNYA